MGSIHLTYRLAALPDPDELRALMDASIAELQKPFLDARQVESSRAIMGLDTQLVSDGTCFIVETDARIAGCGGWSRRARLHGGDQTTGRNAELHAQGIAVKRESRDPEGRLRARPDQPTGRAPRPALSGAAHRRCKQPRCPVHS